jgi:hypothetical protein
LFLKIKFKEVKLIDVLLNIGFVLVIGFILYISLSGRSAVEREEPLTVFQSDGKIELALTDDRYYSFDISDIINKKDAIYERLKSVIEQKAINLSGYNIVRVQFLGDSDGTKEQAEELYDIINSKRQKN